MADDDKEDKKIPINSYTGGSDGIDLEGAYFKYKKSDATYDFYDQDGNSKCTGLSVGSSCSFVLDEDPDINWTITLTNPCSETEVSGNWSIPDSITGDGEGGTFTAQAGDVEDDAVVEDKSPQQDIVIYEVKSDHNRTFGAPLVGCYFSLEGNSGKYKLRGPNGKILHEGVTWNDTFKFTFDSQKWEMSSDILTLENKAKGRWKLLEGDEQEIDGGTFQAQAGGGVPEEAASRAGA